MAIEFVRKFVLLPC